MKNLTIKKIGEKVETAIGEYEDITAFQLVEITMNFYGKIITSTFDTKFTKDGRQLIVTGDGFISDDYDITGL